MSRPLMFWSAAFFSIACGCALWLTFRAGVPALPAWLALLATALAGCAALILLERGWRARLARAAGQMEAVARGAFDSAGGLEKEPELAPLLGALSGLADEIKHAKGMNKGIIEGLPVPFLLVDPAERVLFINGLTLNMLEIDGPPASQIGRTLAEVFYNDPTRQTAVGKSIREGTVFTNLEVVISGHKGGKHHVLANVFPLYDLDRKCIGGLCLYLDMTRLKEKEEALCAQNERISSAAAKATAIAGELSGTSATLAAQVEETSRASEEQGGHMAQMSQSMEGMSTATRVIGEQAVETAAVAGRAREKAQDGAEVMVRVLSGIREVARRAETLRGHMDELGAQAQSVGGILSVISDIADQTNLLALNAAIEAARAGDAGRGFAVVADEVRKLAEKTMTATKEVGETIKGIQTVASQNIHGMEEAGRAIAESTDLVRQSGQVLDEIVRMSESTAMQVSSIATAAEEQSAASEEINEAVDQINAIATETADSMQQTNIAIHELAEQAENLRALVADLKREGSE